MNLRGHAVTMGLNGTELEQLAKHVQEVRFAAGETLFVEGAASRGLMLVEDGTLIISKKDASGSPQTLAELAAPTALGELELLSNAPCTATVIAQSAVSGYLLAPAAFESLVNDGGSVVAKITRNIARIAIHRLTSTNERYVEMMNWKTEA